MIRTLTDLLSFTLIVSNVSSLQISGVTLEKSFLRLSDPQSPWCYTAGIESSSKTLEESSSVHNLQITQNFLATQVWPAARVASQMIEKHAKHKWRICEFGCGPALPSITAGSKLKRFGRSKQFQILATDLDSFALEMVEAAAKEQDIHLSTQVFDLTWDDPSLIPNADLYIMSDVFETSSIARGAAFIAHSAVEAGANVWVFAQYDRAQREIFLQELKILRNDGKLKWSPEFEACSTCDKLWLFDVDENKVQYN